MAQNEILQVGTILYGYCNGFFHADYYGGKKHVEAFGADWIVAREDDGYPNFCRFEDGWLEQREELIREWMVKPSE